MYPFLFEGTPYEMPVWDLSLLVGFVVAVTWALIKRPKDFILSRPQILSCYLLILFFGLVGAKLLYIILHWQTLVQSNLSSSQMFGAAGFAFLGTLASELFIIFAFTKFRKKRVSFLKAGDYLFPFTVLHQAFVRTGCFLTGCCYGKPTNLPWGFKFPSVYPVVSRHPTQIYSIIFLILIFIVLRHVYKRGVLPGTVLFSSLCLYGFFRFFVEFFRVDSPQVLGIITLAQIVMLSLVTLSILGIYIIRRKRTRVILNDKWQITNNK